MKTKYLFGALTEETPRSSICLTWVSMATAISCSKNSITHRLPTSSPGGLNSIIYKNE